MALLDRDVRDKSFFGDRDKVEALADALHDAAAHGERPARRGAPGAQPGRSRIAAAAIPRYHRIDLDFVTTSEFRTLAASHEHVKEIRGRMLVSTHAAAPAQRWRRGGDGHRRHRHRRPRSAARRSTKRPSSRPRPTPARCRVPRPKARTRKSSSNRSTTWSSSSSPPARRASTSTATRVSAR